MPTSRTQNSPARAAAERAAEPRPIQTPAPAPALRLVDDPKAPEIYASACAGFSIGQGNVVLTLESARCNHFEPGSPMSRVVVGRIVLPVQAAQALVIELNNALNRSGHSPSRAATAGMVPQ